MFISNFVSVPNTGDVKIFSLLSDQSKIYPVDPTACKLGRSISATLRKINVLRINLKFQD